MIMSTFYKARHPLTRLSKPEIPLHPSYLSVNRNKNKMAMVGDARDVEGHQNNLDIEELGKFAVDEHNKKQNALLEFGKVVNAKTQVVAGTMHHLTLEVKDGDKKNVYHAKVWEKSWMNFKELQEFNLVE